MTKRQRRFDDSDFDFSGRRGTASGVSTIFLATALGVGIGLLAAPDTGIRTRRRLRKRLETLGDDIGGGIEEVQGLSGRARERMRERLARMRERGASALEDLEDRWHGEEDEDEDSGALGAVLAIAAGVAATYFFTSDRAAPARIARPRDGRDGAPRGHQPVGALSAAAPRAEQWPAGRRRKPVGDDSVR